MDQIIHWFLKNHRSFPWRKCKDPYHVLVSEIMLQQTKAEKVVPFFQKWIEIFPTIHSLSISTENKVMKMWEGLGYYARARNLFHTAQTIVKLYNGNIPNSLEKLLSLKEIGDYTANAILSFAFHQKRGAIDGNVKRVLSRYFCLSTKKTQRKKYLQSMLDHILPQKDPHIAMEGLIELGATLCYRKRPRCHICPLKDECLAHKYKKTDLFPLIIKREKLKNLYRLVVCISYHDHFLILQRKPNILMGGLFEFPYIEMGTPPKETTLFYKYEIKKQFHKKIKLIKLLPKIKHYFTKFRSHLFPVLCFVNTKITFQDHLWIKKDELHSLPFSSGHKKILFLLSTEENSLLK